MYIITVKQAGLEFQYTQNNSRFARHKPMQTFIGYRPVVSGLKLIRLICSYPDQEPGSMLLALCASVRGFTVLY